MTVFEKWWSKNTKCMHLEYCRGWKNPMYKIYTNGGKRKNGDNCFDFNVHFWKFHFWYINYDLQRKVKR